MESVVVAGIAGPAVEAVEVSLGGVAVEPAIHRLTPELGSQLRTDVEAGYFVALLPAPPAGAKAEVEVVPTVAGGALPAQVVDVVEAP